MTITDLVAPEAILPALKVNSKKQALQELSARAATLTGQNERSIFEVLLQREKLGTTAVGYGVAIPHGKLPKLEKLFGLFARLGAAALLAMTLVIQFLVYPANWPEHLMWASILAYVLSRGPGALSIDLIIAFNLFGRK